jgi:hypothetical protein
VAGEIMSSDASGNKWLINDRAKPAALKAYRTYTGTALPYLNYVSPAPDAVGVALDAAVEAQVVDVGGTTVRMHLNGTEITPTPQTTNNLISLRYQPVALAPFTRYTVGITYGSLSNSWSFTTMRGIMGFQAESGSGAGLGGSQQGNPFLVNDPLASGGRAVDFVPPSLTAKPAGSPGRLLSYQVNLPFAGDYALYMRARVADAAGGYSTDSLFIGQTLGANPDFYRINNIFNLGAAAADNYLWYNLNTEGEVQTGGGIAVDNNSNNTGPANNLLYSVPAPGTQTFVIGGRETGLDVDAFAFSDALGLTSAQLDAALIPVLRITEFRLSGSSQFTLTWQSVVGASYGVWTAPSLTGQWVETFPGINSGGETTSFTAALPTGDARYFRVKRN